MQEAPAWDLYVKGLMPLGHGHPLWGPEPCPDMGAVRLGDVGHFVDGHFCRLFNTMVQASQQPEVKGLDEYEPFKPPEGTIIRRPNAITQSQLHSKNLQSLSVSVSASADVSGNTASAGVRFKCTEETGALLMLKDPAFKTYLSCKQHIQKYIRAHIVGWLTYANDHHGLDLKEEDLVFISGTTKTSIWAEAAFHNNSAEAEVVVAGSCFVPSVAGDFSVSIARSNAVVHHREGPLDRIAKWKDDDPPEPQYDQSIFVNYYKTKRRTFRGLSTFKAAAGPQELPKGDGYIDGAAEGTLVVCEDDSSEIFREAYDPVISLLDYVLEHSYAEIASATDDDLTELLKQHWQAMPFNLEDVIRDLAPQVVVDEDGGTLVIPDASLIPYAAPDQGGLLKMQNIATAPPKWDHEAESHGHSVQNMNDSGTSMRLTHKPSSLNYGPPSLPLASASFSDPRSSLVLGPLAISTSPSFTSLDFSYASSFRCASMISDDSGYASGPGGVASSTDCHFSRTYENWKIADAATQRLIHDLRALAECNDQLRAAQKQRDQALKSPKPTCPYKQLQGPLKLKTKSDAPASTSSSVSSSSSYAPTSPDSLPSVEELEVRRDILSDRINATQAAAELLDTYFDDLRNALDDGRPVSWCSDTSLGGGYNTYAEECTRAKIAVGAKDQAYADSKQTTQALQQACIAIQSAHHHYVKSVELLGAIGSKSRRWEAILDDKPSWQETHREAVEWAQKAQLCFNESIKVLQPHWVLLKQHELQDCEYLQATGLLQAAQLYNLMYGVRTLAMGIIREVQALLPKKCAVFARLTRFAVWVQDSAKYCEMVELDARESRDAARRLLVALWVRADEETEWHSIVAPSERGQVV